VPIQVLEKKRGWRREGIGEEKGLEKGRGQRRKGAREGKACSGNPSPRVFGLDQLRSCRE
jgi:hypothetical protein